MSGLPGGWARAPVSALGELRLGKMLDKTKNKGELAQYLRNVNVRWFGFDLSDLQDIRVDHQERLMLGIRDGDLLICEGGEPGRCAVWNTGKNSLVYQKALHRFRSNGSVDPRFLMYQLKRLAVAGDLEEAFTGTTIKHLTRESLSKLEVLVPPLAEQKRIADKLDRLFAAVDTCKARLDAIPAILKRFRQSVLAAATSGKLTDDWRGQEDLRACQQRAENYGEWEVPLSWTWKQAHEIVEPGADIVYGIVQPGPKLAEGVQYVRGMDIENGRILVNQLLRTSPEIAERYRRAALRGGDVLLGIIRATKVAIVPPSLEGANITQGTARFRPSAAIRSEYLAAVLDCPRIQQWLHKHYRGIDMPGLNLADVRKTPIPLPPIEEQDEIIRRTSLLLAYADRLESRLRATTSRVALLSSAVLDKAFRGGLVASIEE